MSRNIIFVLMCRRHRLLDLIYVFHVYIDEETKAERLPIHSNEECAEVYLRLHDVMLKKQRRSERTFKSVCILEWSQKLNCETFVLGPCARSQASHVPLARPSVFVSIQYKTTP
jgi:hypothetical protein